MTPISSSWFSRFARKTASYAGRPATFGMALLSVLIWAALGPTFHYSENWQLVINTSTTIITFLMVFIIQNAQNRDGAALQLKLDELIRVQKEANNSLLDLEDLSEGEIELAREKFAKLASEQRALEKQVTNLEKQE